MRYNPAPKQGATNVAINMKISGLVILNYPATQQYMFIAQFCHNLHAILAVIT